MKDDRIEKLLTSYHLGTFSTKVNITFQNTNPLKYEVPINKIQNQNKFYHSSFSLWHTLNPIITQYSKNNALEDLVFYNPSLLDRENKTFTPAHTNQYKNILQAFGTPHQIKHLPVKRNSNTKRQRSY